MILAGVDHEPSTRPYISPAQGPTQVLHKSEQTAGSLVWLLTSRALLYVLEMEAYVTQCVVFAVKFYHATLAYFF